MTTTIILAALAALGFAAAIAEAAINHRLKRQREFLIDKVRLYLDKVNLYLDALNHPNASYSVSEIGSVIMVGRLHKRKTNDFINDAACIVWEHPCTDENHDYILRCAQEVCDKLNEKP